MKIYRRSELEAIKPTIDADGCLHRYKAIWVDGVDDMSDVALLGIGFAKIKHLYIEALVEAKLSQDFELAQETFVAGSAAAQIPSRLLPDLRQLWLFHTEKWELPLDRFVSAEERGSGGDVGFAPDLVLAHPERNELEIIDDKSGWHPPITEAELKALFQARVYSRYGMDRWPGFASYRFTLLAVRFNKSVSVVFTPQELDAVEMEVRAAIATIEDAHRTNQWPAIAGPSCHFCQLACPLADSVATYPKRLSVEQYQTLGAWLLVAEKQLKAAKKLMKDSCGVYGPCDTNGVVWDNRPTQTRAYPIPAVLELLRSRGAMGAFDDMTIAHSALKKLFVAFPGLEADLAGVAQTKLSYRFGAKQPGALTDGEAEE